MTAEELGVVVGRVIVYGLVFWFVTQAVVMPVVRWIDLVLDRLSAPARKLVLDGIYGVVLAVTIFFACFAPLRWWATTVLVVGGYYVGFDRAHRPRKAP